MIIWKKICHRGGADNAERALLRRFSQTPQKTTLCVDADSEGGERKTVNREKTRTRRHRTNSLGRSNCFFLLIIITTILHGGTVFSYDLVCEGHDGADERISPFLPKIKYFERVHVGNRRALY